MTTFRRVGGLTRLSSSFVSGVFSSSTQTPAPDPRLSIAAAETVLRSALVKIIKTLNSRKYKLVRDEAQNQLDFLELLVEKAASGALISEETNPTLVTSESTSTAPVTDSSNESELNKKTEKTETSEGIISAAPRGLGSILQEHARKFFQPFKMACETGSSRAILVALDGLQKLLSCGFLSGATTSNTVNCPVGTPFSGHYFDDDEMIDVMNSDDENEYSSLPSWKRDGLLIDEAVNVVIKCSDVADDAIHLQTIRCLLTAVTSVQCGDLHGQSLKAAIRSVFKIFGTDRDPQNQRTAQAALTQMVNVIIRRLEHSMIQLTVAENAKATKSRNGSVGRINSKEKVLSSEEQQEDDLTIETYINSRLNHMVAEITRELNNGVSDAKGSYGLCIICHHSAPHFCLQTGDPLCSHQCKKKNLELITMVDNHDKAIQLESSTHPSSFLTMSEHHLQFRYDALLILEVLRKLSMQDIPASPMGGGVIVSSDQRLIQCKRLSLELLLSILQGSCIPFRSDKRFIRVIQSLLCSSLIKNSVSHIPKIFGLSLSIFLYLTVHFKDHLRTEIGVFVDQILLRILESGNSSYEHKHRVLQVLHKLCTDPNVTLELYLNFDCDVEEKDVFARMVDCLAKIAQGKYTSADRTPMILPEQQVILKQMALESIVILMSSLVDWVKKCQEEQEIKEEDGFTRSGSPLNNPSLTPIVPTSSEVRSRATSPLVIDQQSGDLKGFLTSTNGIRVQQTNQYEIIMLQRQRKLQFQEGIAKFNQKPKKGLEFLVEKGHVENSPAKIASFFLRCAGLGKTQIGEYLGEDAPFNQSVLYELVDQLEFNGLEIDFALRKFLSTFRLPGEAQKIDRMMEKFAEKYVKDNPNKFSTADCAYVLAFSLIMLHTDAHSKSIKPENKMTVDVFIRNNRGINDSEDLPSEYLDQLYHRIVAEEWVMEEDSDKKAAIEAQQPHQLESLAVALGLAVPSSGRRKFELFLKESKGIVTKSTELIKRRGRELTLVNGSPYVVASPDLVGQVAYLFKSVCMSLVATFSLLMKTEDSPQFVSLLLKGLDVSIQVASRFSMVQEVELFVVSLAKFTGMTFSNSAVETTLSLKNIQALRILLQIALSEGDTLGNSWKLVLECASQLHNLILLSSGCFDDALLLTGQSKRQSSHPPRSPSTYRPSSSSIDTPNASPFSSSISEIRLHESPSPLLRSSTGINNAVDVEISPTIEQINAALVAQEVDATQLDLLFVRSRQLSSTGIVAFVRGLCEVSREELQAASPRIFSLQKLVEVADYNMNRIRIIWTKIWTILREHFVEAALHRHFGVCLYAVDSLRQLAMKFLEKDELSNYAFQVEFLLPLQIVMVDARTAENIKEFIVQTISNMIKARASNIKSGWKIVFNILNAAATSVPNGAIDKEYTRCRLALDVVSLILYEHFWIAVEHFQDIVRCLVSFASLRYEEDMEARHKEGTESILEVPIEAFRYLEGLAVALAGEDYSEYLISKYDKLCKKIKIMKGGLPQLSTIDNQDTGQNEFFASANMSSVEKKSWELVPRGGGAEKYLRVLLRLKISESKLDSLLSSNRGVVAPLAEIQQLERDVRETRQELQQQLSGYWFPVFTGLSQLATSPFVEYSIREAALNSLFQLLSELGDRYLSVDMWQMTIKGVLFPLFDDLNLHVQHSSAQSPSVPNLHPIPSPPYELPTAAAQHSPSKAQPKFQPKLPPKPQHASSTSPIASSSSTGKASSRRQFQQQLRPLPNNEWAGTRCWAALKLLVNLVEKQFDCVSPFLSDIVNLIGSCIEGRPEAVARLGIQAFRDLIMHVGGKCGKLDWMKITKRLVILFDTTAPRELMMHVPVKRSIPDQSDGYEIPPLDSMDGEPIVSGASSFDKDNKNQDITSEEGIVHQQLQGSIKQETQIKTLPFNPQEDTIPSFLNSMPPACVDKCLTVLKETFNVARTFNRQVEWRHRLKCLGFMREMRQLPGLLKQEREGLSTLLNLLFFLLGTPDAPVGYGSDISDESPVNCSISSSDQFQEKPLDREEFLLVTCREVIDQYIERQLQHSKSAELLCNDGPKTLGQLALIEGERETAGMTPILLNAVNEGFQQLPNEVFNAMGSDIFRLLIDLTLCDSKSLRLGVRNLLLSRFSPLFAPGKLKEIH